jgi:DNA-binding GntR family transcriptional regulator
MLDGIAPARPYRTKEEYIHDSLRAAILQCKLAPGERLVIDQLAGVFAASTIPIRSALQRLEVEGLVRIVPRAGAVVSDISIDMVAEVFAVLEAIEGLAFRFAAGRVQKRDLAALEKSLEAMEQACRDGDVDGWSDLNSGFHLRVAEIAGMELLFDFTQRTLDYWGRIRRHYLREVGSDILAAQAEHREMLRLLGERRGDALVALAARHNRRAKRYYLAVMPSPKPGL